MATLAQINPAPVAPSQPPPLRRSYAVLPGETPAQTKARTDILEKERLARKKEEADRLAMPPPAPVVAGEGVLQCEMLGAKQEEEEEWDQVTALLGNTPPVSPVQYAAEAVPHFPVLLPLPPPSPVAAKQKKRKAAPGFGAAAFGAPRAAKRKKKIFAVEKNFGNGKRIFELTLPDGTIVLAQALDFA